MPATLICAYPLCAKPFEVAPWQAKTWRYCGSPCYRAHRALLVETQGFAARFWAKVDKTPGYGPNGVCWVWTGATHANGYGNFRATPHKPGNVSAHIVAWFLKTGEWPEDGLFVLHACDVKRCVNNEICLFLGTHTDNMQDMLGKGRDRSVTRPDLVLRGDNHPARLHPERMARGERNGMSKLTDAQWAECLALYATGHWTQERLGQRYGVSQYAIHARLKVHAASLKRNEKGTI